MNDKSISCGKETDDLLDSIFNICLDITKPIEERKKTLYDDVIGNLVSGYNSQVDVANFLERKGGKEWEIAKQEVYDRNNFGWSMMVKQMIENMQR